MADWNPYFNNTPPETPKPQNNDPVPQDNEPAQPPVSDNGYTPYQPAYPNYGWQQYEPQKPPKKSRAGLVIGIIAIACVLVIVVLTVLTLFADRGGFSDNGDPSGPSGSQTTPTAGDAPTLQITELDEDTEGLSSRDIVKNNIDSVVLLTMYEYQSSYNGFPFSQQTDKQLAKAGSASGIVMTKDGYIITNAHCVVNEETNERFPRIDVTLYNHDPSKETVVLENAKIIGADTSTDLAVIKVDAKDLQAVTFGDSSTLELGDKVVALGNAAGLGWSATQGIVSGMARDVYEDTGYAIKCLQIDAAINFGNSGGPLFNAAGQCIAINSAKIAASGYEGLAFSIPINEAKIIIDDLLQKGYVTGRVALGITGKTYSDSYYSGYLIYSINNDSPMRKTGIVKGDLIIRVDDDEVTDYSTLRAALAKHKVGDTVTITVLRAQNRRVTEISEKVTLIESQIQE